MTATDELRLLLDERGVEYDVDDTQVDGNDTMYRTTYVKEGYDRTWIYEEPPECDLLVSHNYDLGAEQAIEATLGRGTCHDVGKGWMWRCSECRCRLDIDRDYLPTMWVDGVASVPRFCPNCGRKVVDE